MNNDREQAVEAFTLAVLEVVENVDKFSLDREAKFEEALLKATESLTKEQIVHVLMFMITDHDMFFDIFDQTASQNKTA